MSTIQNSKFKIQNSTSKKPLTMAELMASHNTSFVTLHKGDIIEGKITKLTSGEILIDIDAKAEAVVLEKDKKILRNILSTLKVGDSVTVQVLNSESEMGHPVVSLRKFLNNKLWNKITEFQKSKEVVDITVNDVIKGGLLVSTESGITGFLPNSQISFSQSHDESPMVGSHMKTIVLEADRPTGKIIFSQSQSVSSSDFTKMVQTLKAGQRIKTTITNVTAYGLFVAVPLDGTSIDGFIHISEISWERVDDITGEFNSGDQIEGEIIGFDQEARRVNLSIKKIKSDPFGEKIKNYPIDKRISVTVKKIGPVGASVDIGEQIEGMIKKEKIPPTMNLKTGDVIEAIVSDVDIKKRRIMLTPVLKEKPLTYR